MSFASVEQPAITRRQLTRLLVTLSNHPQPECAPSFMKPAVLTLLREAAAHREVTAVSFVDGCSVLHTEFRQLVLELSELNKQITVQTQPRFFLHSGQEGLADFMAVNYVRLDILLPVDCDANGPSLWLNNETLVSTIAVLQKLNYLGYGHEGGRLMLNLEFICDKPARGHHPDEMVRPILATLQQDYNILFNHVYIRSRLPVGTFAHQLKQQGQWQHYLEALQQRADAQIKPVCEHAVAVDWRGYLYDCHHNILQSKRLTGRQAHLRDLTGAFSLCRAIDTDVHCHGCYCVYQHQ